MEAAQRRQLRDAKKRQRELERQAKEMAKLTALEQARLEVETYENTLDILLSVHKEQTDAIDWLSALSTLPPLPPRRSSHQEMKARERLAIVPASVPAQKAVELARQQDECDYQEALKRHESEYAEWDHTSRLARGVLRGDADSYIKVIAELSPFTELASIGSSLHFAVHNPRLIEVVLSTNGRKAIPSEVKTLAASGKVAVKAMSRPRFVELYQDYICGCVLRVARELFALLPIETLLISASVETLDTSTGKTGERPFLSVAIPRATLNDLHFECLDPSDSVLSMTHRGDLKASRKTGDFDFITPLTVSDLDEAGSRASVDFTTVFNIAKRLHTDLAAQCASLNPQPVEAAAYTGET
jgi:hypothetical protein